jgi:hypothetical protein
VLSSGDEWLKILLLLRRSDVVKADQPAIGQASGKSRIGEGKIGTIRP